MQRLGQTLKRASKTFCLQSRYGQEPLYTDHKYLAALEQDSDSDALAYKEIRFARLWETNSPLQDDLLEQYINFMMRDARRHLMYDLLHKTFYEIKMSQYKRNLKRRRLLEAARNETATAADCGDNETAPEKKKTKQTATMSLSEEEALGQEIEMNPMVLFHKAIENCKPVVTTKKVRRGGATYQVPYPLRASDSQYLAMKWLNDIIKDRPKPRQKHYYEELAWEIIEAAQGRGKVVKKRDDVHKLAQANKAYSHYRWG